MFKELNSKRTIVEGIELDKLPFIKLKELAGKNVIVKGFFFTDGGYGRQVVIVTDNAKVNMPARAVEKFEMIRNDDNMLKAVLEGHLMITGIEEKPTKKGKTVLFELADC